MAVEKKSSRGRGTGKKVILVLLVLAWLAGTAFVVYSYFNIRTDNRELRAQLNSTKQELETYKTNPQEAAKAEVRRYVEEVGQLYALPENEEPSVATVSDKSKLQDQPFFAKAENGDITLIYPNAKLAVLYRPSTKQIVNVSSVNIEDQPDASTQTQPQPPAAE